MYDPSGRCAPGTALRRSDAAGVAARSAFLGELQATATASASISTERVLMGSPSGILLRAWVAKFYSNHETKARHEGTKNS
jgi:hypothetical protein